MAYAHCGRDHWPWPFGARAQENRSLKVVPGPLVPAIISAACFFDYGLHKIAAKSVYRNCLCGGRRTA